VRPARWGHETAAEFSATRSTTFNAMIPNPGVIATAAWAALTPLGRPIHRPERATNKLPIASHSSVVFQGAKSRRSPTRSCGLGARLASVLAVAGQRAPDIENAFESGEIPGAGGLLACGKHRALSNSSVRPQPMQTKMGGGRGVSLNNSKGDAPLFGGSPAPRNRLIAALSRRRVR